MRCMITIKNTNINLKDTITCGQIFRYKEEDDNSYKVKIISKKWGESKINSDFFFVCKLNLVGSFCKMIPFIIAILILSFNSKEYLY